MLISPANVDCGACGTSVGVVGAQARPREQVS